MILLLDNYDSFTYNLYQLISELGAKVKVVRNDELRPEELERLAPDKLVVSPGPGRPEEAGFLLETLEHFAEKIPVLGVCLGHQALAQVFGGKVVRAPSLVHGKASSVRHDGKGVYKGLANPFPAARYHSLMVAAKPFPRGFVPTSRAEDGTLMGMRHRRLPIEGVQFHPESILTGEGRKLLKNFVGGFR